MSNKTITVLNDTYGVIIQEDSKYIVMTDAGKVYEYDLFGGSVSYNWISNILGKGYQMSSDLATAQFYGISDPNVISYIKLINVQLVKLDIKRTVIKDNLEVELYSK